MQLQKSKDTKPEVELRRRLHAQGLRYRVDRLLPLEGVRRRADIVFGRKRVAVFVDGCFWHGCPQHGNHSIRSNQWYWPEKIARNKARDEDTDRRLREMGWTVLRFWEHVGPEQMCQCVIEAILEDD